MGQSRPLFVYFCSFLVTITIQIEKRVDGENADQLTTITTAPRFKCLAIGLDLVGLLL